MLLQVLDDGRLTDGQGRQVSFKNTIIIMTGDVIARAIIDGRVREGDTVTVGVDGDEFVVA